MAVVKWEPFKDLLGIQDRMNRLFSNALRSSFDEGEDGGSVLSDWSPAVDIWEDADSIEIRAELPGMEMKEIDVRIVDHALTIRGEKKLEREEKRDNYHRVERTYGRFQRTFNLPNGIQTDKITATYSQGVLKILLPKREESKPKTIQIEVK